MKTIELTEQQLETLFKCIGSRQKNLNELHKSNLKHGRTNIAQTNVQRMKEVDSLEKAINYQIIDSVGFYEKE